MNHQGATNTSPHNDLQQHTAPATRQTAARLLAFYLPQYHPIAENDLWWGKGFTEWTNVAKARPLFPGHYQPHLPADLGFYDLRLAEARQAQAELAREYGIYGFCYYHYWFGGKRLLERPVEEMLKSGQPDFPFCLCWANETWSRRWNGDEQNVLIKQNYSEEDDRQHLTCLARAFADERYIKIDGKPLFVVYRARALPHPLRTTTVWRETAHALGIGELYLCRVESAHEEHDEPSRHGFDAAIEFQPDWLNLPWPPVRREKRWDLARSLRLTDDSFVRHVVLDYPATVERMLRKDAPPYKRFPCVMPMWDNFARREEGAHIFINSTPEIYEMWLTESLKRFVPYSRDENLVFINAWNEWAEGNHLEPCQKWGRAYLEATRNAIANTRHG